MTKTIKLPAEDIVTAHNLARSSAVNGLVRKLAAFVRDPLWEEDAYYAHVTRPGIKIFASVAPIGDYDDGLRDYRIKADIEVLGRRINLRMPTGEAPDAEIAIFQSDESLRAGLITAIDQIPAEASEIVQHTRYRIAA